MMMFLARSFFLLALFFCGATVWLAFGTDLVAVFLSANLSIMFCACALCARFIGSWQ